MSQQDSPLMPPALLQRLLSLHFSNSSTKISTDALDLTNEYLRLFVQEAICRANLERKRRLGLRDDEDGGGMIEVQDLEKVLAQLLLDF